MGGGLGLGREIVGVGFFPAAGDGKLVEREFWGGGGMRRVQV